jgi:DNA-binding NarL/FixJ family response regulator
VILDLQLPTLSGLETLRIIRQEIDDELPAIVVSSHVSDSVMSEALALHAFTVLSKMVGMHRILHAVGRVLAKHYSL